MNGDAFVNVWHSLQGRLKPGTTIRNWTALKGHLGDEFQVVKVSPERVVVQAPKAKNIQSIPQEEFCKVWQVWEGYKAGRVERQEIRDLTRHSKYILSIFHTLEEE